MADEEHERQEPIIRDKRRIDPETGQVRPLPGAGAGEANSAKAPDSEATSGEPAPSDQSAPRHTGAAGDSGDATPPSSNVSAPSDEASAADEGFEGPDVETSFSDADLDFLSGQATPELQDCLADLKRVNAEYANYRKRTEANKDAERERAVGDAARVLLPVLDDLDRAEKHGDLTEGGSFATIAGKMRAGAEKLGLQRFAPAGEPFDPALHEAIFQQPSADVDAPTVAEVVETGYYLGSTLLRAAKVVVAVPNG